MIITSTASWRRSKCFPTISRFSNSFSGNFMGKFRRLIYKQLGRRIKRPEWRLRWRAIWQCTDSWHHSSRALGTTLAGLGHLPRIAERSLVDMPLILGRKDPEGIGLQASSLLRWLPRIRQHAFLLREGGHLPSESSITWAGTSLSCLSLKGIMRKDPNQTFKRSQKLLGRIYTEHKTHR